MDHLAIITMDHQANYHNNNNPMNSNRHSINTHVTHMITTMVHDQWRLVRTTSEQQFNYNHNSHIRDRCFVILALVATILPLVQVDMALDHHTYHHHLTILLQTMHLTMAFLSRPHLHRHLQVCPIPNHKPIKCRTAVVLLLKISPRTLIRLM